MTHDGFLQDICEHPDDDAPRLIYADWLEDNGDPLRAQFIRVQCEIARLPADDPRRAELAEQEAMFKAQQNLWRAALPKFESIWWDDFGRGFVEAITTNALDAFLHHAPAVFAAAPVRACRFNLSLDLPGLHALCAAPYLARLAELNLGNSAYGSDVARDLVANPRLGNLTSLLLYNNRLGDEGVRRLAENLHRPRLRELYLSGNNVGDAGAAALAASPRFPALTDLDLRDNRIGDAGAVALAASPEHTKISTLYLVNNRIGSIGASALAESPHLPQLRYLYLNHNPIGDEGARAFARTPQRANLIELDLRNCQIANAGAQALAESPHLNHLKLLLLTGNSIRDPWITQQLWQRFDRVLRG